MITIETFAHLVILYLLYIVVPAIKCAKVKSGEYRLKQYLMHDYSSEVRPVVKDTDKVILKFEIALQQLVEVVSHLISTVKECNIQVR